MKTIRSFSHLALVGLFLCQSTSAAEINAFFERPVSCPLRLSNLSSMRDSLQILHASLGPDCAKNAQGALTSLNSSVSNLEGITNSFNTYNKNDASSDTQYAKNVNQILGSLNVITSNTACVYDIRKRGLLPVISDVVMSVSQFGLLVPSASGMMLAAGGYVAGSALKIINELIKDKFNFNKAEDRKSFMQLNCSFFDARKSMEESGIFDLVTDEYRQEYAGQLRKERAQLIKELRSRESSATRMDTQMIQIFKSIPEATERNLDPVLLKKLDSLSTLLSAKPGDYATKWKQVSGLAKEASLILEGLNRLAIDSDALIILRQNLEKILPDLAEGKKAWNSSIDEWEILFRGPLMAFIAPVANSMRSEMSRLEDELALNDQKTAMELSQLKNDIKEINSTNWILTQRILSLESKISNLEKSSSDLFSDLDEGRSNEVEILDYYRKLQNSILGNDGRNYIRHSTKRSYQMQDAVDKLVQTYNLAKPGKEQCSAAEKLRFAWTQYRYQVQEAYDFVATNLDLYRSSFILGKERLKWKKKYVLSQMDSVQQQQRGDIPEENTVGDLMINLTKRVPQVERTIHESNCF